MQCQIPQVKGYKEGKNSFNSHITATTIAVFFKTSSFKHFFRDNSKQTILDKMVREYLACKELSSEFSRVSHRHRERSWGELSLLQAEKAQVPHIAQH